jgi:hypothetical protein
VGEHGRVVGVTVGRTAAVWCRFTCGAPSNSRHQTGHKKLADDYGINAHGNKTKAVPQRAPHYCPHYTAAPSVIIVRDWAVSNKVRVMCLLYRSAGGASLLIFTTFRLDFHPLRDASSRVYESKFSRNCAYRTADSDIGQHHTKDHCRGQAQVKDQDQDRYRGADMCRHSQGGQWNTQ